MTETLVPNRKTHIAVSPQRHNRDSDACLIYKTYNLYFLTLNASICGYTAESPSSSSILRS